MSDSAVADVAPVDDGPPANQPPGPPASGPARTSPARSRAGLFGRVLLAVVSGAVLALAFPGAGLWPLAFLSVAGLTLATRGVRARSAAGLGWLFGMAFFVPHLHWSGIYVGAFPWLALATAESIYLGVMAFGLPRAWRLVDHGRRATAPLEFVLAVAGLWVVQEAVRGSWPFGGFPWGRLGFSQSTAPTAGLAAVAGVPLITAAVAAIGALLAYAVVRLAQRRPSRSAGALVAAAAVLTVGLLVPLPTAGQGPRPNLRVAAVQGNVPEAGLEFNAERRAVLDNHAKATLELARKVAAGTAPQPDLVIWPENSSDIDPLRNPDAAEVINDAADAIGVPVILGAVLDEPVDHVSNASLLWLPGTGPVAKYVKQHPAPFAEYIPYRSFFRHFSDKVDLVTEDFIQGKGVGLLNTPVTKVGDVICFEVAYDGLVRDSVKAGATMLAVQTNNATFGYSDESVQQLAMSRLRAIESGRSVVHISTVGISAIIRPDGTVERRSGHFTQDVLQSSIPLRTSETLATRLGAIPEWTLALLGLIMVALAGSAQRSGRRDGRSGGRPGRPDRRGRLTFSRRGSA